MKKGRANAAGEAMESGKRAEEPAFELKADLEYEDEAEDEFEEEELVPPDDDDSDEELRDGELPRIEDDAAEGAEATRVWRPGIDQLEPGEELEFDPSAYDVMHSFHADWPCLTFAIVPDSLGSGRTKGPFSSVIVTGTQASTASENKLLCMKVSKLARIKHDRDDDDMDDSDNSDDDMDEDPVMEHRGIKHDGAINRLCLMPQQPSICATWAETGKVHIWDLSSIYASVGLGDDSVAAVAARAKEPKEVKALFSFGGHMSEGFALDFSKVTAGRLATGDCDHKIYTWSASLDGRWAVDPQPYAGHTGSVEVSMHAAAARRAPIRTPCYHDGRVQGHTRAMPLNIYGQLEQRSRPTIPRLASSRRLRVVSCAHHVSPDARDARARSVCACSLTSHARPRTSR